MDEQNFKDLAYRAWSLYKQMYRILQSLNETFWQEFCELDEKERKQNVEQNVSPF
jgi:hypothetical protein